MFDLVHLPGERGLTGHLDGVVTFDLAEADPVHRDALRRQLGEPFRTLLGSLRHEVGHHYWRHLVVATGGVASFRAVFGDERADYGEALQRYYAGDVEPWDEERFVTAYARSHPHEDWAETFAHYLHIVDLVDTAADHGLLDVGRRRGRRPPRAGRCLASPTSSRLWRRIADAVDDLADTVGSPHPVPGPARRRRRSTSSPTFTPASPQADPIHQRDEDHMADKSPRQHQSKKAGKTLKEKRGEKKAKQASKPSGS